MASKTACCALLEFWHRKFSASEFLCSQSVSRCAGYLMEKAVFRVRQRSDKPTLGRPHQVSTALSVGLGSITHERKPDTVLLQLLANHQMGLVPTNGIDNLPICADPTIPRVIIQAIHSKKIAPNSLEPGLYD